AMSMRPERWLGSEGAACMATARSKARFLAAASSRVAPRAAPPRQPCGSLALCTRASGKLGWAGMPPEALHLLGENAARAQPNFAQLAGQAVGPQSPSDPSFFTRRLPATQKGAIKFRY